jgi:16S rRNA (guanine1516-N2)-methyltransferase
LKLFVEAIDDSFLPAARSLAESLQLPLCESGVALEGKFSDQAEGGGYLLSAGPDGLSLRQYGKKNAGTVSVDFVSGALRHRRLYGGGKGQSIAKAVGLGKGFVPAVLDCTAGLGRDAFVLASLGCEVSLLERNPVVHALLEDGLNRAINSADKDLRAIILRMHLIAVSSIDYLQQSQDQSFDVIYLDPMFPARSKSALVKKEMRFFHQLVGDDSDADQLLDMALKKARYRVVVKRPARAEPLAGRGANFQLCGKSSRYDIYTLKAFP